MNNSILGFILLILSLTGWGMLIHHKCRINASFIPIFLFSSIICLVYSAGLMNFMPHMVYSIFLYGLLLFGFYVFLILRKEYSIKELFLPSTIIFVLMSIVITLWLKGVILMHYDNFSHWGLIVKEMFRIDGLPDSTTIIQFRNYPPGSAVFIYFIGKIIGPSESHSLMAQGFLLVANLAVLFAFYKWKEIQSIVLSHVVSITLMIVISAHIYNLLVDTLLGVIALSVCIIAYYYRENWKKSVLVNLPLLIVLILVKDSGKIFFVFDILIIFLILVRSLKKKEKKQRVRRKNIAIGILVLVLVPLFFNFLWLQYIDKAYPALSYDSNKFALSTEKITDIEKSDELIASLGPSIFKASTDINSNNFLSLTLLNLISILLIIGIYIGTRKISKLLLYTLALADFIYFLYILSLYLMYLFLMPEGEASYLAGFSRYQATIIIYCSGLLMTAIVLETSRANSRIIKVLLTLVFSVIFLYPFKGNIAPSITKPVLTDSIRLQVKNEYAKIASTGAVKPNVLYYSPRSKDDRGYLYFILMYEQLSNNYSILNSCSNQQEKDKLFSLLKESNFLVVLDTNENFNSCLSELIDVTNPKGVYEIKKADEQLLIKPLEK